MKVFVCLVASLALCHGASLPAALTEDVVFDLFQSFLVDAQSFAAGAVRSKRAAWDKDINLPNMGITGGIKYIDPSEPIKGAKAEIVIANVQAIVKNLKEPMKLKLNIDADGGASTTDGLFNIKVDYEADDSRTGSLTIDRSKTGKIWTTEAKLVTDGTAKYVKPFSLKLQSDRETMLLADFNSARGIQFNVDMKKNVDNKVDADIDIMGQKYKVNGEWIKGKKLDIAVNDAANGNTVLTLKVNRNDKKSDIALDTSLVPNLGSVGLNIDIDKVAHKATAKVLIGGNPVMILNVGSKLSKDKSKYGFNAVLTDNIMGTGKSSIKLKYLKRSPKMTIIFTVKPGMVGVKDFNLNIVRTATANSRDWQVDITRGGEKLIGYNLNIQANAGSSTYNIDVKSHFDLSENSKLYPVFCTYGCWTKRDMVASASVEKTKIYKMVLTAELRKDGQPVLNLDIDTKNNPYKMILKAPRILPKILPSGRSSIEFNADHQPGKKLAITSNTNSLPSLIFERLSNQDVKVILNGKELVTGGLTRSDKQISSTTTLPDGRSLTTTLKWATTDLKENTVDLILEGTERNLNANLKWNFKDPSKLSLNLDAAGNNKRFGDYSLNRVMTASVGTGTLKFNGKGSSSFQNAPWPSPIQTDIELDLDYNKQEYYARINKVAAGVAWGITLQRDGEVVVNPSVMALIQTAMQ